VIFSDLNLLVKYGGLTSEHEYHCLQMIRTQLGNKVPVPKVYGCDQDGDEVFTYVELIHGRMLEQRWDHLSENDRMELCSQLRPMIAALREVKQASGEEFIGSITGGKLLDHIFEGRQVGAFASTSTLNNFCTRRDWSQPPRQPPEDSYEMRFRLPGDPITFTHSDLHRSNIMITAEGQTPRILAIIDWRQPGWCPAYWEYCKARWTVDPDDDWVFKYLPTIIKPQLEAYDAWNYICLCH
jgi:aminoglycoside phosphotransferase (APT) family kinase protein